MKKLSLIVPCYNEEKSIGLFYNEVIRVYSEKTFECTLEIVFVNDGSKDATWFKISELINNNLLENVFLKGINFSRNFGKEAAIMAGLKFSTGDCCIVIDADLQHPVEKIYDMKKLWDEGFEVVDGVKITRADSSFIYKICSLVFYGIMSKVAGFDMSAASDFKLLSRRVVNEILNLNEYHVFFRGLSSWVGFKRTKIGFNVKDRAVGTSKWSRISLIRYAVNNITSFSTAPLMLSLYIGAFFFVIAIILSVYTVISYFLGNTVSGFSTIIFVMLFVGGCSMISFGTIGYYIKKIFEQVQGRPNYIVADIAENNGLNEQGK